MKPEKLPENRDETWKLGNSWTDKLGKSWRKQENIRKTRKTCKNVGKQDKLKLAMTQQKLDIKTWGKTRKSRKNKKRKAKEKLRNLENVVGKPVEFGKTERKLGCLVIVGQISLSPTWNKQEKRVKNQKENKTSWRKTRKICGEARRTWGNPRKTYEFESSWKVTLRKTGENKTNLQKNFGKPEENLRKLRNT